MDICLLFFFQNGCTEAPLTEYEKMKDKEIMKNNQKMASLGIRGIANQMKKKSARSKDNGPELSGSLFNPQGSDGGEDNEGSEQEITSKVLIVLSIRMFPILMLVLSNFFL